MIYVCSTYVALFSHADPLSTQLMLVEDDCQVDSFDVSWRSSPDQSVCELTYKVTLSIITLNGSNNIMVTNFTNNTYFNFTGLISNTFYSVEVVLLHNNDSKFERINVTTKAEPLTTTSTYNMLYYEHLFKCFHKLCMLKKLKI